MNNLIKKRTLLLFWAFSLVFLLTAGHLVYIQIYNGPRLSQQALAQQSQEIGLELPMRGLILDRNQEPLVHYRNVWRVVVFPPAVIEKEREALSLAGVINRDYFEILSYFNGNAVMLPWDVTDLQAEEIKSGSLPGVVVVRASLRDRKQDLASHILGYLGIGSGGPEDWEGLSGLENRYNESLKGNRPKEAVRIFQDAKGRFIAGLGYQIDQGLADQERKNVVTTLDLGIQAVVERVLDEAGVRQGAAVVMNPSNGDILAMASRPDFSLNGGGQPPNQTADPGRAEQPEPAANSFVNKAVSFYQPGSVFKVVVVSAALEEGVVNPDDPFYCVGANDSLVSCYKEDGHGELTLADALAVSCNPTIARVGLKLGAERLVEYAGKFGFDKADIIGYQALDRTADLARVSQRFNLVNASLGQWPVEANAVQVTAMMAAIANDGVYLKPRLVQKVLKDDGTVDAEFASDPGTRAVSAGTAREVRSMLEMVTTVGTGTKAYVEGWGSAGKTGSAQTGAKTIDAWFSGYAPVAQPRYAVTVLVPEGSSGGGTAAPLFKKIMEGIMQLETERLGQ